MILSTEKKKTKNMMLMGIHLALQEEDPNSYVQYYPIQSNSSLNNEKLKYIILLIYKLIAQQ